MKKTLILAFAGSLCFSAKAQTQFGVQAGGLLNAVTMKYDGEKAEGMKPAFGFKAGVVAKVPFSEDFSFMPELNVLLKGGKQELTESNELYSSSLKSTFSPLYLEVPLNFAYTADLGSGSFFLGVGPVVSLGLGGKVKTKGVTSSILGDPIVVDEKNDIKFDGKDDATDEHMHLKRLELSANLVAGYQLTNGLFAKAFFNQGISNLHPVDKATYRNTFFGLAVGFMFGGSSSN